jgi:hypothetical protein
MTRRRILLIALAVLVLTVACTDLDMDRDGWGWDGSKGDEPAHVEEWGQKAEEAR